MTGWLGDHAGMRWSPGLDEGLSQAVIVGGPDRTLAADCEGRALCVARDDARIYGLDQHLVGTV